MIALFDEVKIKESDIIGTVVEIYDKNNKKTYIVEALERGTEGGYGTKNSYKLYYCSEVEIEKVEISKPRGIYDKNGI